jgi:amino acid adenylation domain-containing protein
MSDQQPSGFRLSPQQRRVWSLAGGGPVPAAQAVLAVAGHVSEEGLHAAVDRVVARHEVLRTTYERRPGLQLPVQVVSSPLAPAWRTVALDGSRAALDALLHEEGRALDPARGPVLRLCLARAADGARRLVITLPALAADAASLRVFARDVARMLEPGAPGAEPAPPIQYADAAEVMNGLAEADGAAGPSRRWAAALAGAPGPCEPRWVARALDGAAVRRVAAELGCAAPSVLLAAWQVLLDRVGGGEEAVVAVGLDGRTHDGLDEAMGPFVRFVPIALRGEGSRTFADVVGEAEARLAEAAEWQDFFSWEGLGEPGAPPPAAALGFDCSEAGPGGGALVVEEERTSPEPFEVRLSCTFAGDTLVAHLVHDERVVSAPEAERLAGRYAQVLSDGLRRPRAAVATLDVLPESERRILAALNATAAPAPDAETLVDLFAAQASAAPGQRAVVCGAAEITFGELDARAERLAHDLRRRGVGPDVCVGLLLSRSVELVVGLMGILKSGGAYVPIDPATPPARIADMLADTGARVVVTEAALVPGLPPGPWDTVCLLPGGVAFGVPSGPEPAGPTPAAAAHNLAYVIFTSGSTGRPKGVGVTHAGLANYVRFMLKRLDVQPGWSFGLATTIAADLGHTSLYPSLASGGCLHVLEREVVTDAGAFARRAAAQPLDVLKVLPSHFAALLADPDPAVLPRQWLVFGGEALPADLCRRVAARGGRCRVLNHYGPTETTVGVLTWRVEAGAEGEGTVPIGRPIDNSDAHVLDVHGQPAPLSVAGELYLGGAGLARGYHGRPDLTAERFVPHPTRPGARLYRTGDRVRCRPDGTIEFLGRCDHQVKIRGHRVEPGEVEVALLAHPAVAQAAVVARRDEGGESRLVAYVVAAGAGADAGALRAFLGGQLPEYMVPAAFVSLPALPRGTGGKVDRAALPAPAAQAGAFTAPRNETERTIAAIWAAVLRLPRVGVHDDFFELGGDSIVSIQVAARAARAGLTLTPLDVFRHPTVALSAAVARPATEAAPALPAVGAALLTEKELRALLGAIGEVHAGAARTPVGQERLESVHALSPLQQGMLFHCAYQPAGRPYVTQMAYTLAAGTDVEAFAAAWQALVDRHAILRTAFAWEGLEEPRQAVLRSVRAPLQRLDLRGRAAAARDERLAALAEADLDAVTRAAEAPVFRVTLARLDDGSHRCFFTYHHLLLDGWSEVVLGAELKALYEGRGTADLAPAAPYGAFVDWLRGQDLEAAEAFWRRRLAGVDAPTPLPGLGAAAEGPAAPSVQQRTLDRALNASLGALARRQGLTFNTLVQGAWALVLGAASGRHDVVFGATASGRPAALPGVETIVGPFINSLPVRVHVDPAAPAAAWLARVQDEQLDVRAYEFSPLVDVQRWAGQAAGSALFETLLVFQNAPAADGDPGLQVEDVVVRDGATGFPLSLDVRPGADLVVMATHDARRIGAPAVEHLLESLESALGTFVAAPAAPLATVIARLQELARTRERRAEEERVASSRERLRQAVRRPLAGAAGGGR